MTELLITYEKSFRKNNDMIMNNFNKISIEPTPGNNNDLKTKINRTYLLDANEKLIEDQKKILKQMELELSSLMDKDYYDEFNVKLSSFKKSVDLYKKKLNELYSKEESKNSSFMSESNLLSEKNSILINREKYMFQRSEKLQQVRRTLSSTEEMGTSIMVNMDDQSKEMKKVTGKLKNMGQNLDESNKILNKMKKRAKKNKRIIIIFVILLICVFVGVLSLKLYKKFK